MIISCYSTGVFNVVKKGVHKSTLGCRSESSLSHFIIVSCSMLSPRGVGCCRLKDFYVCVFLWSVTIYMWKRLLNMVCHPWKTNKQNPTNSKTTQKLHSFSQGRGVYPLGLWEAGLCRTWATLTLSSFHSCLLLLCQFSHAQQSGRLQEVWTEGCLVLKGGFSYCFFLKSWEACTLTLVHLHCKCGNQVLARMNPLHKNLIAGW